MTCQVASKLPSCRPCSAKLPPRWPQEASRWQLGPTWPHLGLPVSAQNIRKPTVLLCFCYFTALRLKMPKVAQRWSQESPRRPQGRPKSLQDDPKRGPARAQAGPKTASRRFSGGSSSPNHLQVASKLLSCRPCSAKWPPSCLHNGPKSPQDGNLAQLGLILDPV